MREYIVWEYVCEWMSMCVGMVEIINKLVILLFPSS